MNKKMLDYEPACQECYIDNMERDENGLYTVVPKVPTYSCTRSVTPSFECNWGFLTPQEGEVWEHNISKKRCLILGATILIRNQQVQDRLVSYRHCSGGWEWSRPLYEFIDCFSRVVNVDGQVCLNFKEQK